MADYILNDLIKNSKEILNAVSYAVRIVDDSGNTVFSNKLYENMKLRSKSEMVSDSKNIIIGDKNVGAAIAYHDISEINRLRKELDKLNQKLRQIQVKYTFADIIGEHPKLKETIKVAKGAATTNATIMIRGESGTGKEIFANAIYNGSNRRHERFVKVNCTSIPEALMESEIFGYKEGAFTGALRGGKKGLFQEAHRGTLFLDEIGDISLAMQVKLLRVLQEKEVMPIGSTEAIPVDVRIICATNKPLEKMVEEGTLREDLYYRLNVFPLYLTPLRERPDDIEPIVMYLVNQYNELYRRNIEKVDPLAIAFLKEQEWKGNVRELENVLSRTMINMDEKTTVLKKMHFITAVNAAPTPERKSGQISTGFNKNLVVKLSDAIEETERSCILAALERNNGDKNMAAYELGLPLRTLYYRCSKLGIS